MTSRCGRNLQKDLPHVEGDRVQLQQVLLNLIINAIEAMRTSARRSGNCSSAPVANRMACQ